MQRERPPRARRPVILLSFVLAGILLAMTMWQSAYPEAVTQIVADRQLTLPIVNRAIKADIVGSLSAWPQLSTRSAFSRLWDGDGDAVAAAVAPARKPAVYFAYADTVDDVSAPFAALFAGPSLGLPLATRDLLPLVARSETEAKCLADAIYFEARGEGRRGELAVAQVVINRVKNPAYPKTICGVVYQNKDSFHRCQFSFACDGVADRITDRAAWREAMDLAEEVVADGNATVLADVGLSTHYHATYVSPLWAGKMKMVDQIGHHIFYAPCGHCAG